MQHKKAKCCKTMYVCKYEMTMLGLVKDKNKTKGHTYRTYNGVIFSLTKQRY